MTKEEWKAREQKIIEMRQEGLGYREIADALGADRKNVCKACRRLGVAYTEEEAQERNGNNPISEETAKDRLETACPGFKYISGYEHNTSRVLIRRVACGHEFLYTYSQACARGTDLSCQVCRAEATKQRKEQKIALRQKRRSARILKARNRKLKTGPLIMAQCGQLTMAVCAQCESVFVPKVSNQRYCCRKCATQNGERRHEEVRTLRMRNNGQYDRDITLSRLFIRDCGKCWICGGDCLWNDTTRVGNSGLRVGPRYPSIDHVVPLAKGGEHAWHNVRLAHMQCNSFKGIKSYPPQCNFKR